MSNFNLTTSSQTNSNKCLSPNQLACLDANRMPRHIAIIPDGNRRWAKKNLLRIYEGHSKGVDALIQIIKAAKQMQIKEITIYGFSTENWHRPQLEVQALISLIHSYLVNQTANMVEDGVKFETIGEPGGLPQYLLDTIKQTKHVTQNCSSMRLIMALNYGARNEICRAFRAMLQDYDQKKLQVEEINETLVGRYLDTHAWSDPDLLIRTSGELRVSNFLLWQLSYSEIHVSSVLWPDFTPQHLYEAIIDFQNRKRRWGGG